MPNIRLHNYCSHLRFLVAETIWLENTEKESQPVQNGSRIDVTSKKRIRDPAVSIAGRHEDQSSVHGIKVARSTLSLHTKLAATQSSVGKSNSGRVSEAAQQTSITPSPHLSPTIAESRNARSNITKSKLYFIPSNLATSEFVRSVHPVIENNPTYHHDLQVQRYVSSPTFRSTSNLSDQAIDNCVQSSHISKKLQAQSMPSVQSDSWKRLKHQQHKSQQRAFVRRSDNPFKNYKHDPNDTESYLDQLVSSSNETTPKSGSIIPPEGFLAIGTVRHQSHFVASPEGTWLDVDSNKVVLYQYATYYLKKLQNQMFISCK
jgi:hypothetical protein